MKYIDNSYLYDMHFYSEQIERAKLYGDEREAARYRMLYNKARENYYKMFEGDTYVPPKNSNKKGFIHRILSIWK